MNSIAKKAIRFIRTMRDCLLRTGCTSLIPWSEPDEPRSRVVMCIDIPKDTFRRAMKLSLVKAPGKVIFLEDSWGNIDIALGDATRCGWYCPVEETLYCFKPLMDYCISKGRIKKQYIFI